MNDPIFARCPHCRTDVQVLSRRDGAIVSRIGCDICTRRTAPVRSDATEADEWSAAERYESSHWSWDEPHRSDPDWPAYAASVGLEP